MNGGSCPLLNDRPKSRRPAILLRRLRMEMTKENSEYIGDGVYAGYDGMGIWLHVGSHDKPTDKVYLEDYVFDALITFAKRAGMIK